MKTIKEPTFKAWHIENKKMLIFANFKEFCNLYQDLQEDIILLQSTELKDKNEKMIFIGDIVKYTCKTDNKEQYIDKVKFNNGYIFPLISTSKEDPNMQNEFNFEIIGNQFENPKLLNY